jgi:hypothetical protein
MLPSIFAITMSSRQLLVGEDGLKGEEGECEVSRDWTLAQILRDVDLAGRSLHVFHRGSCGLLYRPETVEGSLMVVKHVRRHLCAEEAVSRTMAW